MSVQSKPKKGKQLSIPGNSELKKLDDDAKRLIVSKFRSMANNQMRNIAEETGYTLNQVNKAVDQHFAKTGPNNKIIFRDSKWNDPLWLSKEINRVKEQKKRYGDADLEYYVEAVLTYSEKNLSTKRTERGWLATLRQFMNSDKGAGKYRKRQGEQAEKITRRTHQNF